MTYRWFLRALFRGCRVKRGRGYWRAILVACLVVNTCIKGCQQWQFRPLSAKSSRRYCGPKSPIWGAAALILRMRDVACQACVTSGRNYIMPGDGAQQILRISRGHYAPDAVDAIYREVDRFAHVKRTAVFCSNPNFFGAKQRRKWRREVDYLRSSSHSCACRMQRRPRMRSRWFRPVFRARWLLVRRRNRCVDSANPVEARLVNGASLLRPLTRPWGMRVITQLGQRAAGQSRAKISRG